MGVYLWGAVQECWPPDKHRDRPLWDTIALFYFWKDYDLQARLSELWDPVQRDATWPEESEDAFGYTIVTAPELELLRQHTPDKPLGQRFDALEATAKAVTRNPVRVLFWKD